MSSKLRAIFSKAIDRPLDGVIKADDEVSLLNELEEYVVTNEIEKNVSNFLTEYNNYTHKNGVWISGFFGSGKSHLLKILSVALEDKKVEGQSASDIFLKKFTSDAMLKGELEKAFNIPSKSILFNIDQKATIISKDQVDAILTVFQSVFDEFCGYHRDFVIAKLERDLDVRGLYEPFKAEFKKYSDNNISWEQGRDQAAFESDAISRAFASVTKQSETDILQSYSGHKISIESFAQQVKEYISKQEQGFRINFFVDEVGQYIADNVKLMTNLQTIAESLNTICEGKAWIIVTAQEALDKVVGDINAKQQNDFSRVMARFDIRMPLTSKNVAEVIQKRLLRKTLSAENELKGIYEAESSNFGTLFTFADGTIDLRNFIDESHFIRSYPFIPYQYVLFRESIRGLSDHNSFEGKHSSVGERSMLGVFRDVLINLADLKLGQLATFDLMFLGIRTALKSSVQSSISVAEDNLEDEFAVRILKVLFLVKYYRQFKPTLHNISILMIENFKQDISELRKRVENACLLLENQTYIQKNGEFYEFLTDEERDIEEEIKSQEIDKSDISDEFKNLLFRDVIATPKIRHTSGADYKYAQKIDGELKGQDSELAINLITPANEDAESFEKFKLESSANEDLLIIIGQDPKFLADLILYKKTEKYVRLNQRSGLDEVKSRVLNEKGLQNSNRYKTFQITFQKMISKAKLIVRADELEIREGNAKTRIEKAFQLLINKVYSNLSMLRDINYSEPEIAKSYTDAKEGILGDKNAPLTEAEQAISNYLVSQSQLSLRVTVKSVIENFERIPYGWPSYAILSNIAALCGSQKIEAIQDSNQLKDDELIKSLRNTNTHSNTILQTMSTISAPQIKNLKSFVNDFFDHPAENQDPRGLAKEILDGFKDLSTKLKKYQSENKDAPFLDNLSDVINTLQTASEKDFNWVINKLPEMENDLLDQKESVIDPVMKFMDGPQVKIYMEARQFLKENKENFSSLGSNIPEEIETILNDPDCYKNNQIHIVKTKVDDLKKIIDDARKASVEKYQSMADDLLSKVKAVDGYQSVDQKIILEIDKSFEDLENDLSNTNLVDLVPTVFERFKTTTYPGLISKVSGKTSAEVISSNSVNFTKSKPILETDEDVDEYINNYKQALKEEIKKGKRITV